MKRPSKRDLFIRRSITYVGISAGVIFFYLDGWVDVEDQTPMRWAFSLIVAVCVVLLHSSRDRTLRIWHNYKMSETDQIKLRLINKRATVLFMVVVSSIMIMVLLIELRELTSELVYKAIFLMLSIVSIIALYFVKKLGDMERKILLSNGGQPVDQR